MKLINRTTLSDVFLEDVLKNASKSLGLKFRTTNVVVYVFNTSYDVKGYVIPVDWVRWRWKSKKKVWEKTDKAAMAVGINISHYKSYVDAAIAFFDTARHEWGHVRDFQKGEEFSTGKRRPRHEDRIEERRVFNYTNQADKKGRDANMYYDSIIKLALELSLYDRFKKL